MGDLDPRKKEELYSAFEAADTILMKKYIEQLSDAPIYKITPELERIAVGSNVCLYHIDKIVYDKDESIQDKLTTVYSSILPSMRSSLIMLVCGTANAVDLYLGIVNRDLVNGKATAASLTNAGNALKGTLEGNFPGTVIHRITPDKSDKSKKTVCVSDVLEQSVGKAKAIAAVSTIPALRSRADHNGTAFIQGLEKLIDSMRGKSYAVLLLADPVGNGKIEETCAAYEDIYSQLSPFRSSTQNINTTDSESETSSIIEGLTDTTSKGLSKAVSHSETHGKSSGWSVNGGISGGVTILGPVLGNIGLNIGGGYNRGKSSATTDQETNGETTGEQHAVSRQNSIATAVTSARGESLQIVYESRSVKTLLDRIDEQIKRLRTCQDLGMFDCCAYILSPNLDTVSTAAGIFKSLMRGENSSIESSAVNIWDGTEAVSMIKKYLLRCYHPMLSVQCVEEYGEFASLEDSLKDIVLSAESVESLIAEIPDFPKEKATALIQQKNDYLKYQYAVTPALMISGKEMAYMFGWPQKSVVGLPVLQCAEFGRNAITTDGSYQGDIDVGKVYHMHKEETTSVALDSASLTSHVFVTGSTGAGKSNTVYEILYSTCKDSDVHFMVIEPAKGEYKRVLGAKKDLDVTVYGTNPKITKLLRINPFEFPESVHVYEHMDRLIELFNVCWPMYAAMPAVLKAALEQAYISAGWDLNTSDNITGVRVYPTFSSVAREVRNYIDSSEYSAENKSDYKGALVTRLESLTNGINSMIFSANAIPDSELFDKNVIVDLSRIGSSETKALIMGVLVMRLQEWRSGTDEMNSQLKHITVLEEAHNLLKRTSSQQSSDGANLVGKSVEMIANSIAEMRTYGEAFVIVDQAPGLLDMSVIRNTNTKIIHRLPDYADRELVGKAANLNEKQIIELAKLPTGVAAIYQNNWISPILCKINEFKLSEEDTWNPTHDTTKPNPRAQKAVLDIIMHPELRKNIDVIDGSPLINLIVTSDLPDFLKVSIIRYLGKDRAVELAKIAYEFFNAEDTLNSISDSKDIQSWQKNLVAKLQPTIKHYSEQSIEKVIAMLIHEHCSRYGYHEPIYISYMEKLKKG